MAWVAGAQIQLDLTVFTRLTGKTTARVSAITARSIDADTIVAWISASAAVDFNAAGRAVEAWSARAGGIVQIHFATITLVHWRTDTAVTVSLWNTDATVQTGLGFTVVDLDFTV